MPVAVQFSKYLFAVDKFGQIVEIILRSLSLPIPAWYKSTQNKSRMMTRIVLGMGLANERRRYNVTSSHIGWAHTQNDP